MTRAVGAVGAVFRTPRLRARRLHAGDVDGLVAVGDADAMRWVGVTAAHYARHGYGMFALERRGTGARVGFIGLVHPGGQAQAEIQYALHRVQWGQGFASEAAAGILAWARAVHAVRHAIATTAPENAASHRVLEKAGLQRGALRDNGDGTHTQRFAWGDAAAPRAAFGFGPLFRSDCLAARALRPDEVPALQTLLDANPGYFHAVGDSPPGPTAAQDIADDRPPPHLGWSRHHVLGLFEPDGGLAGTAVVVEDLAAAGMCHIALYLLADRLHGSGQAQVLHAALAAWATGTGARWLRLTVVAGNARAERFWARLGYAEVRQRGGALVGGRPHAVRVLVRPLGGHTLAAYLDAVPRDRPDSLRP